MSALPLWQRATISRARSLLDETNRSARARWVLWQLLVEVGQDVSLVQVGAWSRRMQGAAYLWAIARRMGIENVPPPWEV